jgi:hypothetical protein
MKGTQVMPALWLPAPREAWERQVIMDSLLYSRSVSPHRLVVHCHLDRADSKGSCLPVCYASHFLAVCPWESRLASLCLVSSHVHMIVRL